MITNIGSCVTLDKTCGKDRLGLISDAAVAISRNTIEWVGPKTKLPKSYQGSHAIDVGGALVTPGLVDCHTHIAFAGSRADEFFMRLEGKSYEEIAEAGGGIWNTVSSTRKATNKDLQILMQSRLDRFRSYGVTTVEIKSGYGLSTEKELSILRDIGDLKHAVDTVPTFLGAHTVPPEFDGKRQEYVRLVCEEMIPAVAKEKLASACDVFCDKGAFTLQETLAILSRAKEYGLGLKAHADQLTHQGATEALAKMGALSVDHLEHVSEAGIHALAKSSTVGVLLPGAVFFLGKQTYPPARKLIESGVRVALSTDCNPGTSYTENFPLMMSFAAIELKMTAEEIWEAVTKNAAQALGLEDRGMIQKGKRADLVVWEADDYREVPYHYGACMPSQIIQGTDS